ncbi:MAG: DUF3060 domain-containing protein [Pyrinomonadaceae bacterium]
MKILLTVSMLAIFSLLAGCDAQSGIASKSVEKYIPTPTPVRTPEVVEQIDPADAITVDTAQEGPRISILPSDANKNVDCSKYNEVRLNGDGRTPSVKGVCKQLMINGDKNHVTGVAFTSIVLNGTDNQIEYSKYDNGKKPAVTDNGPTNNVTKIEAPAPKTKGKP